EDGVEAAAEGVEAVAAGAGRDELVDPLRRSVAATSARELAVGVAAVAAHDGREVGRDELRIADRHDRLADLELEQALLEGAGPIDADGDDLALREIDDHPRVEPDEVVVAGELGVAALALVDIDDGVEAAAAG